MTSISQVRETIKRNASEISSLHERQTTLEKELRQVKDKLSKLNEEQNKLKAQAFDLLEQSQREADAAEKRPPLVKRPSRYSIGSNGSVISAPSPSSFTRSASASVVSAGTSSSSGSSSASSSAKSSTAGSTVSSGSAVSSASRLSASTAASSVQSAASKPSSSPSSLSSAERRPAADKKPVAEDAKSILLPNPWENQQRPKPALRAVSSHASFTTPKTEASSASSFTSSSSSDNPIYAGPPTRNSADEHDPTHIAPYYPASVLQQRTLSLPACAWLSEQWDLQHVRPLSRSSTSSSTSDKDDERSLPPMFVALADRMWAQTKWRYLTDEIRRAWEAGQWRFRLAPHQVGGPPFGRDWTPRAEENWEKRQVVLDRLRRMGHLKDLPKQ